MKKLILIVFLSFLVLSCTKEDNKIENQTRIKNDIPDELLGKWKIISEEWQGWDSRESVTIAGISPLDTGKEQDLWIKEYSICCLSQEDDCDQWWYAQGVVIDERNGTFAASECGKEIVFSYFYTFDSKDKDIVLIAEGNGEGWSGYRYKKVE